MTKKISPPVVGGFFRLKTANDLADKILAELEAFRARPDDDHLAFNIAVSIGHWPEWTDERSRFKKEPSFVACLQLANGAKHHTPTIEKEPEEFPVQQTAVATIHTFSVDSGDYRKIDRAVPREVSEVLVVRTSTSDSMQLLDIFESAWKLIEGFSQRGSTSPKT